MKLIIEDDEGRRTVIPFVGEALSIGRLEDNQVLLSEKNVSRKHGRIYRNMDGRFFVEDLESFTGIRVNGEKIKKKRFVWEGDLIQISEYDLSLQSSPDELRRGGETLSDPDDTEPTATSPTPGLSDEAASQDDLAARRNADTAVIRLADLPAGMAASEARDLPSAEQPRIVGLSGAFRGKEWSLARTPISLGRGGENDVVIDHPSVSRVHATLGLEDGTWKVIDAESRNGLLVNGEPYAASALRGGDTLELGHLKFAFVMPGQQFALPIDMTPPRQSPPVRPVPMKTVSAPEPRRSLPGLFAGAAALAVLLAFAGYFVLHGRAPVAAEPEAQQQAQRETPVHPPVEVVAPVAPEPSAPEPIAPAPVAVATAAVRAPAPVPAPAAPAKAKPEIAAPAAVAVKPAADDELDAEPRRLISEGNQKLLAQDFAGAIENFQRAVALKPANAVLGPAYRSLGIAYTRQGNVDQGANYYRLYLPLCTVPKEREYLTRTLEQFEASRQPAAP